MKGRQKRRERKNDRMEMKALRHFCCLFTREISLRGRQRTGEERRENRRVKELTFLHFYLREEEVNWKRRDRNQGRE